MIPGVIAKRYATALLELGSETGQLDALVDELQRAASAYEGSPELRAALADPLIAIKAKQQILGEVATRLNLGPASRNTLSLLLDRRRIRALPPIAQRRPDMADDNPGILRAEVLTAMPLPVEYFTQLHKQLERVTGRRIALDRKLDDETLKELDALFPGPGGPAPEAYAW